MINAKEARKLSEENREKNKFIQNLIKDAKEKINKEMMLAIESGEHECRVGWAYCVEEDMKKWIKEHGYTLYKDCGIGYMMKW